MKRCSIEVEIDILQALSRARSLRMTHIMYAANVNMFVLKDKLLVLEKKGLIKVLKLHKNRLTGPGKEYGFYDITPEGLAVLRSFGLVKAKLGSAN
jgi:predicted transcriptional regulator